MAWNNAVVTNGGVALLQQVLGGKQLILDSAGGGSGTVDTAALIAQTALKNKVQTFNIANAIDVSGGKRISVLITNKELETAYDMQQLGIWAHIGTGAPALFAILQDDKGINIPSESEMPDFAANFYVIIDFSGSSNIQVSVNPQTLLSHADLDAAGGVASYESVQAHIADPIAHMTQAQKDQLAAAVPKTRKINNKALSSDISLNAADVNAVPTTRKVNGHALSADVTVTKADVGLSNVNNTSDANKPVSTATQEKINDLAGSGRTTETVKGNADNIAALQSEKANFTKVTGSPDFNALTTTGLYGIATSSYTNGPSGLTNWGLLIVDKSGNGTQTFLPDGTLFTVYRRNSYGSGTWNAWNAESWISPSDVTRLAAAAIADDTHSYGLSWDGSQLMLRVDSTGNIPVAKANYAATLNGHGTDNGPNSVLLSGRKSGTTIGANSTAEGSSTTASGSNSHAEGDNTNAIGSNSHAEGDNTTASSIGSHAEGNSTTASGIYSHAEGGNTNASGSNSHAEGDNTNAIGSNSHAEGDNTNAIGEYSHVEGINTRTTVCCSHVQGINNKNLNGNVISYSATADAMVIGNGSSGALSNCFRVTFDGKVYGLSAFNSSGADYSEFFEWADENPSADDRVGHFVTLDGEKIKYANDGDYIVGITSGNPAVIGDHPSESWNSRYLRDAFGRLQYEDVVIPAQEEKDKEGNVIRTVPEHTETHFKVNPDYDPTKEAEYENREKRPEWATVGMLGKLVVIDDGTCEVNGYCKPSNGIATKADIGYRVIARLDATHIKVLMK